jgi:hypothetical protein
MLISAVTAAFALVACGDDDDGLPTGDVSKQAYIAEADQICEEGDATVDAEAARYFGKELGLRGNEEPTPKQASQFVEDAVVPEVEGELDDLRALEAPEGDADQLEAIYNSLQEGLDALAQDPEAFAEGENPFEEFNRRAQAYGFKGCGSN